MSSYFISVNNITLEYKKFGFGKEYIIAFHGMGREADDYKIFENTLGERYTIIAINLFFHGNTKLPPERQFKNQVTKKEFSSLIQAILLKESVERFNIMGYSLGGRISLSLVELMHKQIDKLILIAPDGLKRSSYNDLTTQTLIGRFWVNWLINNPDKFFRIIKTLNSLKIISDKSEKVIRIHFEDDTKRRVMRNAIASLIKINPNLKKVSANINSENIDFLLIFGKFDFIIPAKLGNRFFKKINSRKEQHIIKSSHNILTENASKQLSEIISTF